MTILSPNELCRSIFSLSVTNKITSKNFPQDLKNEISKLLSEKIQARKIKKELSSQKSYKEVLTQNSFGFPINKIVLEGLNNNPNLFALEANATQATVFYSFLSWILTISYPDKPLPNPNDFAELANIIVRNNITMILNTKNDKNAVKTFEMSISIMFYILKSLFAVIEAEPNNTEIFIPYIITILNDILYSSQISTVSSVVSTLLETKFLSLINILSNFIITNPEHQSQFIHLLGNIIKKYKNQIPTSTTNSFFPIISNSLSSFQTDSLDFLAALVRSVPLNQIAPYMQFLSLGYNLQINSHSQHLYNCPTQQSVENTITLNSQDENLKAPAYSRDSYSCFSQKVDMRIIETVPCQFVNLDTINQELNQLLSPELHKLIDDISHRFKGNTDFCSQLANHLGQVLPDLENSYDFFITYFLLFDKLRRSTPSLFGLPEIVFNHQLIFDPSITMFDQMAVFGNDKSTTPSVSEEDWSIINLLRMKSLQILISTSNQYWKKFILSILKFPALFAEVIYRLTEILFYDCKNPANSIELSLCHFTFDRLPIIIDLIFAANSFYRCFNTDLEWIQKAKVSILHLLNKILDNENHVRLLFEDNEFIAVMCSFIVENNLSPFVREIFSKYAKLEDTNYTFILDKEVSSKINNYFYIEYKKLENAQGIEEVMETLHTINDLIEENPRTCHIFEPALSPLSSSMLRLPKSEEISKTFLNVALNLIVNCSHIHSLQLNEIQCLEKILLKVFPADEELFSFLKLVLYAKHENEMQNHDVTIFRVSQPGILRIMLHAFNGTEYMEAVLDLLVKLCEINDYNKVKMNLHEIDIILIELIEDYRNKPESKKMLKKIYSLFCTIASYSSSIAVVQRFIPLMCIENGNEIPNYHKKTIKTFEQLVSNSTQSNFTTIPFEQGAVFTINKVMGKALNDDFTLLFWVCHSSPIPNYIPHLCTINDKKNNIHIDFSLSFTNIMINVEGRDPIIFNYTCEPKKWFLLSIAFNNESYSQGAGELNADSHYRSISVFINSTKLGNVYQDPIIFNPKFELKVNFGGLSGPPIFDLNEAMEQPSLVCQFSLYLKLKPDGITRLSTMDREHYLPDFKPLFVFTSYDKGGSVELHNLVPNSPVCCHTYVHSLRPISFANIFSKRIGVDRILPLFGQWDLVEKADSCSMFRDASSDLQDDGKSEERSFHDITMRIFRSALVTSNEAQKLFSEAEGFHILSHLLRSVNEKFITYRLYTQFYDIYLQLSYPELKQVLFTTILTKIEIWIRCTPDDHHLVLEQWANVLFPQNLTSLPHNINFTWIITTLRVYYFYMRDEQDICTTIRRVRNQHVNIADCRKALMNIATLLAQQSFNDSDFLYLLYTIMTSADLRQRTDYLKLLKQYVESGENSPLLKLTASNHYFNVLLYGVVHKNKEIAQLSLEVLILSIRKGFNKRHPSKGILELADILNHQMGKDTITPNFYDIIFDSMVNHGVNEFFGLCSWIAMNLGLEYIQKFYTTAPKTSKYIFLYNKPNKTINPMWCLWPMVTIFRLSEDEHKELKSTIIKFIVQCSLSTFNNVYAICDFIATIFKQNEDEIKLQILQEFKTAILEAEHRPNSKFDKHYLYMLLFQHTKHFLFFRRSSNCIHPGIDAYYKQSAYFREVDKKPKEINLSPRSRATVKFSERKKQIMILTDPNEKPPESPRPTEEEIPFANMVEFTAKSNRLRHSKSARKIALDDNTKMVAPLSQDMINEIKIGRKIKKFNSDGSDRYSPKIVSEILAKLIPESAMFNKRFSSLLRRPSFLLRSKFISQATSTLNLPEIIDKNTILASDLDNLLFLLCLDSKQKEDLNNCQVDYKNIENLKLLSYNFGIRMDKEMKWIDLQLALDSIQYLRESPDLIQTEAESIFLIAAFALNENPTEALKLIHDYDPAKYVKCASLLDLSAMRNQVAIRFLPELTIEELRQNQMLFYQEFATKDINVKMNESCVKTYQYILHFEEKCSLQTNRITTLIPDGIYDLIMNKIVDFKDIVSLEKNYSSNKWQLLWKNFTMERAPWAKSLSSENQREQHYRQDFTLCYSHSISKFKKNLKYDSHAEAARIRDLGKDEKSKSKFEQDKEEFLRKHENDIMMPIFDLIDDASDVSKEHNSSNKEDEILSQNSSFSVVFEVPCDFIKIGFTDSIEASFLLTSKSIIITLEEKKKILINLDDIEEIYPRTHFHHASAIEIFLNSGKSYFVNFQNMSSETALANIHQQLSRRSIFRGKLSEIRLSCNPDLKHLFEQTGFTEKWVHGQITNFEYLMALNFFSGRSINDISQYPIFPWILTDYEKETLDIDDQTIYRDLSKPVGALNATRLNELKNKEKELEMAGMDSYLYSSCYSCPLIVCLYLMRIEPFTSRHIEIQGGKFDHADRLFNSIHDAFKLCTTTPNDYRELIPEFFVNPHFLVNSNHYDLGNLQTGEKANDVALPKWAESPIDFIYKHRKALESGYVSIHLNEWIDLIWGDKQQGEKAKLNDNVFIKEMYGTIWDDFENLDDLGLRSTIEAIQCHVGQIPMQLFTEPHPCRIGYDYIADEETQKVKICKARLIDNEGEDIKIRQHDLDICDPYLVGISIYEQPTAASSFLTESMVAIVIFDEQLHRTICHFNPKDFFSRPISAVPSLKDITHLRSLRKNSYSLAHSSLPSQENSRMSNEMITSESADSFSTNESIGLTKVRSSSLSFLTHQLSINSDKPQLQQQTKTQKNVTMAFNGIDAFDIVGENTHELLHLSSSVDVILANRSEITATASDKLWTAMADRDANISLFYNKQLKFTIPIFSGIVRCCQISSTFHLCVVGTNDNCLLFCSLNSGTVIKTVHLEEGKTPISLLITHKWGFVALYSTQLSSDGIDINYKLDLYSVNGDLLRSCEIERPVSIWNSFSDDQGFDYFIMVNDCMKVYVFEAFYLNIEEAFYSSESQIIAVNYIPNDNCAVFVTSANQIVFIKKAIQ